MKWLVQSNEEYCLQRIDILKLIVDIPRLKMNYLLKPMALVKSVHVSGQRWAVVKLVSKSDEMQPSVNQKATCGPNFQTHPVSLVIMAEKGFYR